MVKLGRTATILFLVCCLLTFSAASLAQTRSPVAEQIAKTYGLDSFGQVDAIRYTWAIDIPGLFSATHVWEWEPKTGKVSFQGKGKDGKPVNVTYMRSQLSTQPDAVKKEVEPAFVNDNYWLVFPLHAYWDSTGATVTDQGTKKLPLGGGSGKLVSVKYPSEGGYTPGDTWDLYVGKDGRVAQFVYHRGGPQKPSLVTATWAGNKMAGGLLISTEHRGNADGKPFHLWISDVSVKLAGSDKWVNAQ